MAIFVMGNLGSGKSTLVGGLEREIPGSIVINERFKENPLLRPFTSNPSRYSLSLQMMFLVDYIMAWEARPRDKSEQTTLVDAGVWTNLYVFTRAMVDRGLMTLDNYSDFMAIATSIIATVRYPEPDIVVHVTTLPKTCLTQIKDRGRDFEQSISLDYLKTLDALLWQMNTQYRGRGKMVITVNNEKLDVRSEKTAKIIAQAILERQSV